MILRGWVLSNSIRIYQLWQMDSLRTLEDVSSACPRVGVQIDLKLMKLGGLAPTLEILLRGKELGIKNYAGMYG